MLISLIGLGAGRNLHPLPSKMDRVEKRPIQMSRPYNLAHRGANGEFPEETAPAYMVWVSCPLTMSCSIQFFYVYVHRILVPAESHWRGGGLYRIRRSSYQGRDLGMLPWCEPGWHNRCCRTWGVCRPQDNLRGPRSKHHWVVHRYEFMPLVGIIAMEALVEIMLKRRHFRRFFGAVDFTLEELQTLRAKQRYAFRNQQYNGLFTWTGNLSC